MAMGGGQTCPTRWKLIRRFYAVLLGLSLVAMTAVLAMVMPPSAKAIGKSKSLVVTTMRLSPVVPCTITKDFVGQLLPGKKSELGFLAGGRIKKLLVSEGDRVEAGDILAELDSSTLLAELAVAKAELKWAQQNLEAAPDWQPKIATIRRSLSSEPSIAINQESSLQTRVEHWSAVVSRLELQREQSQLKAPYEATVTQTYLSDGSIVAPDRAVVRLVGCAETVVKVAIPVKYVEMVRRGESFTFTVGTSSATGTLKAVLPEFNEAQQTYDALFLLTDTTAIDATSRVQLHLAVPTSRSGYRIPRSAVSWEKDGSTAVAAVRGVRNSGKGTQLSERFCAVKEAVEVLQTSDQGWVVVQGNLHVDDRIVAVMPKGLQNNQEVRFSDYLQWRQEIWLTMP